MTRPTKERGKKPRTKKTTTVIEEALPQGEDEQEGPSELDFNLEEVRDTERLYEVLEQFPDAGITVKIYDQHGAYRFTPPDPKNIDPELIRLRCGAGQFVGRVYVDGKYRQSIDIPIGEVNPDPNTPTKPGVGDSHTQFLEKLLLAFIAKEHPTASTNTPTTLPEMVQSLAGLDALRGKQESGMDLFLKGLTLGKELNSDSGGSFDWKQELFRMVANNAPTILDGVQALVATQTGGRKTPPPNPPAPIAANPESQGEPSVISEAYFKEGLKFLKQRMIAGMQNETIINWVYDNRDDPTYQPFLKEILSKDFDFFVKLDVEIGQEPFKSKFLDVYNGIRTLFNEQYEMDLDTGRGNGDPDDITDNGTSGKAGNR